MTYYLNTFLGLHIYKICEKVNISPFFQFFFMVHSTGPNTLLINGLERHIGQDCKGLQEGELQ